MPKNINGKPVDESKWAKAKALAAEEGHADDYKYIMGIYKKMTGLEKSKLRLILNLEKGRKAVPDGTIKDVKGTPYKRMKQGNKWVHVKVNKQGVVTNMAGQVIGQVNVAGNAQSQSQGSGQTPTQAATSSQSSQAPVKRGRGRPKGAKNKPKSSAPVAAPAPAPAPKKVVATNAKKRGRPRKAPDAAKPVDAATKVEPKKVEKKTAKKAEAKKKKDTYAVGDRVMRKNASGNYYWSRKEADGTWSYEGMATPAEAKTYLLMLRRKKAAEKQRANNAAQIEKVKNAPSAAEMSDWNSDGTPKQAALDKMSTKEKKYWTEVTDRARALCDKSGILCLDKEAEDYVEEKLDTIFKDAAATTVIKEADPTKPLDTNAAFSDDIVFMEDTLTKLEEYYGDIQRNEKQTKDQIQNRIIAELNTQQDGTYHTVREAMHLQDDNDYARYISEHTHSEYLDLLDSVAAWINAIKANDKDSIAIAKLRALDEKLAPLTKLAILPSTLAYTIYPELMDILKVPRDEIMDKFTNIVNDLKSLGIDESVIKGMLTEGRGPEDSMGVISSLITLVLHPGFDTNLAAHLTSAQFSNWPILNTKIENGMLVNIIGANGTTRLTPDSLAENAKKLREKYPAVSKVLDASTYLVHNSQGTFNTNVNEYSGYSLELSSGYHNKNGLVFNSKGKVGDLAAAIKELKSAKYFHSEPHFDKIASALGEIGSDTFLANVPYEAVNKLKEARKDVSSESDGYIKTPQYAKYEVNPPAGSDNDIEYHEDTLMSPLSLAYYKTKTSRYYSDDPMDYGIIEYAGWKADKSTGTGQVVNLKNEKIGETANLKAAQRAKWNSLTTIQTAGSAGSYYSSRYAGTKTHAASSLATAIGLNWQIRKITKKNKIIPEWKWYPGTKPFDEKNSFPVTQEAIVDDINFSKGRKYVRNVRYKSRTPLNDKYKFTPEKYVSMLTDAKNDSIAAELGMLDADIQRGTTGKVIPKICLKTVTSSEMEAIRQEVVDKWTHKNYDFQPQHFKVYHAFNIMYHDYYEKYKAVQDKIGNVHIGFTSTNFAAGSSIIKGGFKLMPVQNGNMLGIQKRTGIRSDRVYSTSSTSKTIQYLNKQFSHHGHGVMFRVRIAMGKVNATGADTVKAIHDPTYNTVYGQGDPTGNRKYGLDHDEHAVKDPMQMIPLQWIDVGRV